MRKLLLATLIVLLGGGLVSVVFASEPHVTDMPAGTEPAPPDDGQSQVPCDILLRYDDGEDDSPGSGYTLGGPGTPQQNLGIIATPPAGALYEVQSAAFWSEFWVTPGNVHVVVTEVDNPTNTTEAVIYVDNGGTWEVAFDNPICVDSDFSVMLCPEPQVWGVAGEDLDPPIDGRSYWEYQEPSTCSPVNNFTNVDLTIWACVTPCGATPTESTSWGHIKSLYR
jgi:hypothetical protein